MAEAIALGASVIAIIQLTELVVGSCKYYIGTVREAPSDLRVTLLEISALKSFLENLKFLTLGDNSSPAIVTNTTWPKRSPQRMFTNTDRAKKLVSSGIDTCVQRTKQSSEKSSQVCTQRPSVASERKQSAQVAERNHDL